MSRRPSAPVVLALLVALLAALAGCSALERPGGERAGQHRFVVENGYVEAQNVTVTIDTPGAGPTVAAERRLTPGEQWVVATLNGSALSEGYTMSVTAPRGSVQHETDQRAAGGATLVVLGDGLVLTCGGNVTCYETAD